MCESTSLRLPQKHLGHVYSAIHRHVMAHVRGTDNRIAYVDVEPMDRMLDRGDTAPAFTLRNQDDEPVTLEDIEASYVVVYFYPRADTPGCTTEACGFKDEWGAFADADVAVVGISDDPVADLTGFAEKFDLPFDLLSDPDGEVSGAYDSYGEKSMFGNTFDGVFRNTYVVDADGTVVLAYEGVSPEGHATEILEDIAAL